ncbi:peroxisomal 2,4-dienoyl-CoA reductase [(3E)-enoyl-CoA-producing]-like [Sycon ciliatum]|uniref:peroxisomal 2,4-dienoyl-CoA reductase [(3E)-enoyl-CoA-producing]-like n=1 Tax=Sycon ciliatum TaxID=27933 RepID=UPI0031F6A6C3
MTESRDVCLDSYQPMFRENLLQNQVALISGGGSGIGFRITEVFMRHGCDAIIMGRKEQRLREAAARLSSATGRTCIAAPCDVRQSEMVDSALREALSKLGNRHVNILVNGAAGNFLCAADSLTPKGFRTVLDIDAVGSFILSRCVYDRCFSKNGGGVILNISATLYYKGDVLQAHAGAAKAAVDALTRHLAVEWGDRGVRVNSLSPGPIEDTEGFDKLGGKSPMAQRMLQAIPLARFGTRTDIANAAVFLVSPAASYVSGITMVVDGGAWMTVAVPMSHARKLMPSSKL